MARPSKYSPEVRERAVRMVFEHAGRAPVAVGGDSIGRREARAARRRRCAAGCARPSAMPASAPA